MSWGNPWGNPWNGLGATSTVESLAKGVGTASTFGNAVLVGRGLLLLAGGAALFGRKNKSKPKRKRGRR